MLLTIAILTFLVWYVQYHWNRRYLYKMAAKFPGPTPLPFIGNALLFAGSTRDIFQNVIKLNTNSEVPVRFWLGQRLGFVVTNPKDLEIIMNSPSALKKEELYKYAETIVGTGLFTAPVEKWKRHRKLIMPTFNQQILNDFVPVFVEQSTILVDQLKNKVGKGSFDIFQDVSRCTLDIICETAMGVKVGAQTEDSDYVKWVNKAMEIAFKRMFNVWLHSDFAFNMSPLSKEMRDLKRNIHHFTQSVVKEKKQIYQETKKRKDEGYIGTGPPKRNSFLQQLMELSEKGANFKDEELCEEVDTFMIAGSETTASMNCFIFIMLGMFPDIQEKVHQEVLEVLGPSRQLKASDLNRFVFLERVIKETMRIFPVGPFIARSITRDINLGAHVIPSGSSVVLGVFQVHRNEKYWPQPTKFDPDRFLPEKISKCHPYSWLPFSGGPRNCVGIKYAYMAMKSLIATVVRKYKFSTSYQSIEDIKLKADLVLKPINGYNVSVELRL